MRLQDLCSINKRSAAESTITVHGFDLCRGISEPELKYPTTCGETISETLSYGTRNSKMTGDEGGAEYVGSLLRS